MSRRLISPRLEKLAAQYERATTQKERDEAMVQIDLQSRKEELDRERKHRRTDKGKLEASSRLSLDALMAKFDDPSKIAALSDGGMGARKSFAEIDSHEKDLVVALALKKLDDQDRVFAIAVLNGATEEDLGMTRQGFNWKLRNVSQKILLSTPQKTFPIRHEGACEGESPSAPSPQGR